MKAPAHWNLAPLPCSNEGFSHRNMMETALQFWDGLDWRYHHAGVLQAYITVLADVRLHVWLPGDMVGKTFGVRHNHRFDLRSSVLVGKLIHQELFPALHQFGSYRLWEIEGASKNSAFKDRGRCTVGYNPEQHISAGQAYCLDRLAYHSASNASQTELCITFVEMFNKRGWATLIANHDESPQPAVVQKLHEHKNEKVMKEILSNAKRQLRLEGFANG